MNLKERSSIKMLGISLKSCSRSIISYSSSSSSSTVLGPFSDRIIHWSRVSQIISMMSGGAVLRKFVHLFIATFSKSQTEIDSIGNSLITTIKGHILKSDLLHIWITSELNKNVLSDIFTIINIIYFIAVKRSFLKCVNKVSFVNNSFYLLFDREQKVNLKFNFFYFLLQIAHRFMISSNDPIDTMI
ncbi:hypothetical protein BpHYR1_040079 [Brachionus plicatilis]|uniref:Uncharacterized protein n=1 Tax=Brachionus plicatilis TaxID=10195 RepID=A0A3M7RD60_BRAPC|nr:hypothetical protein BpHYR1_040079 [Brachionus plicatilis]